MHIHIYTYKPNAFLAHETYHTSLLCYAINYGIQKDLSYDDERNLVYPKRITTKNLQSYKFPYCILRSTYNISRL